MRLFVTAGAGGALARRLVPVIVLAPILLGLVHLEGQELGLLSTRTGTWMFLLGLIGLSVPLVYTFAQSLDLADAVRLRTAAALQTSEARYRALAESAVEAIVSADSDGQVVFANEATERVFGWPPDELVGRSLTELIPERFRDAHREGMRRYLLSGSANVRRQDGRAVRPDPRRPRVSARAVAELVGRLQTASSSPGSCATSPHSAPRGACWPRSTA